MNLFGHQHGVYWESRSARLSDIMVPARYDCPAPSERFILDLDVAQHLPCGVDHLEALSDLLDVPTRREPARCHVILTCALQSRRACSAPPR
jgi:hypothetical protein